MAIYTREPLWCSEAMILPESLIDILDTTSTEESYEDIAMKS